MGTAALPHPGDNTGRCSKGATGSGIARLPAAGLSPATVQPGGGTDFHNAGDAPAGTTVSNGPGNVLGFGDVLCVFWGSAWNNPSLSPGVGDIFAAVAALSDTVDTTFGPYGYCDGLKAYSGGNFITWGYSVVGPPLVIPTNPPNNPFSLNDVSAEANTIFNTPNLGADNVFWDLVVIFMPPGFNPGGPQGEHSFFTDPSGNPVNFAYISYAGSLNAITYLFSHELVESLTDPHGDAWQVNPRNANSWNEICDVCASSGVFNGVTVTSYFSSIDGACMIPSPPPAPLPPDTYLIDSVRKSAGSRYITEVSGPGTVATNGRWALPEFDVVAMINGNLATFYTEAGGVRAAVAVERWYLETVADGFAPNNLDNLPIF